MKVDFNKMEADLKANDSINGKATQTAIEAVQLEVVEWLETAAGMAEEGVHPGARFTLAVDPAVAPDADWSIAFRACAQLMKEGC